MKKRNWTERRNTIRRGAHVKAYLYREGGSPLRCHASNLSADGVFLHTRAPVLRPGEVVSLVFTLEYERIVRTYRRWARVAHASDEGVGMQLFRERPAGAGAGLSS